MVCILIALTLSSAEWKLLILATPCLLIIIILIIITLDCAFHVVLVSHCHTYGHLDCVLCNHLGVL